jgi:hypothetical protein
MYSILVNLSAYYEGKFDETLIEIKLVLSDKWSKRKRRNVMMFEFKKLEKKRNKNKEDK